MINKNITLAFRNIDRKDFVPEEYLDQACGDYPLPIGFGQTISQPSTVAFMFELLNPKEGDKVLDVGSGSGWTTALLADIVGEKGRVFGVELVLELVELGRKNLSKYDKYLNAQIYLAGKHLGLPGKAPFDRILVSASGEEIPEELIKQLKVGGVMVVPVLNSVWKIKRVSESGVEKEEYPGFVFVPLKV